MLDFKSQLLCPGEDVYATRVSPVSCFTEWDPLEEVIVGTLEGAMVPQWHVTMMPTLPIQAHAFFKEKGRLPFAREEIIAGQRNLDELADILRSEGVIVRRP